MKRIMSPTLEQNHPILEVLKPDCTANRFSFRGSQIMVPAFDPDHLLFHVIIAPDGSRQIKALTPQESGGRIPGQPYDLLARVRRQCSDFPLSFPSQQTDPQGHAWDFLCGGILSVADGQRFVEKCFGLASVGAPLRRDRLAAWLAQAAPGQPATLLVLNLNGFQHVNDAGGREAGDALLRAAAVVLLAQVRAADSVARLEGDTYALLLPGCVAAVAVQLGARLQAELGGLGISHQGRWSGVVATVGVAEADRSEVEDADTWLTRAMAAWYAAQCGGQGRAPLAAPAATLERVLPG